VTKCLWGDDVHGLVDIGGHNYRTFKRRCGYNHHNYNDENDG
jgi:hypothetical protein